MLGRFQAKAAFLGAALGGLAACAAGAPPASAPSAPSASPAPLQGAPPGKPAAPVDPTPVASGSATGWKVFEDTPNKALFEATLDRWSPTSRCAEYDYFPRGGIQNFWCHRPEDLDIGVIRKLAGVDIFAAGPHKDDSLALGVPHDFGRYNPAFVRWLIDKVSPAGRDTAARRATQASYEANLRPLAEIFWKVHEKAIADPACFERERRQYEALLRARALPRDHHERWFFFMNPFFCSNPSATSPGNNFFYDNAFDAGVNGNVTKAVVGFWIRRSIDGTRDAFAEGLRKLLASYQPSLLDGPARFPDPRVLSLRIDEAVTAASSCKHLALGRSVHLTFSVRTSGKFLLLSGGYQAFNDCVTEAWEKIQIPPFDGEDLRFRRPLKPGR
jgi:hypothetical protein